MTIQELRTMKRFPKGEEVVSARDKATIIVSKICYDIDKKGRKKYIYEANIHFIYENGLAYRLDVRENTLKFTLKKAFEKFDQRNLQMINYEKRGLNL